MNFFRALCFQNTAQNGSPLGLMAPQLVAGMLAASELLKLAAFTI